MPSDFPISSKRCGFCKSVRMFDKGKTMEENYIEVCMHPRNIRDTATLHCCKENCPPPDSTKGESIPKKHDRTPEEIAKEKHIDPNIIRARKKLHNLRMKDTVSYIKKARDWVSPVEIEGYLNVLDEKQKKVSIDYCARLLKKVYDYPEKYGINVKHFKIIREKRFLHGRRGFCYKLLSKK